MLGGHSLESLSEGLSHAVLVDAFVTHSSGWRARVASSVHTGGSALAAGGGFCGWNKPRSGKCLWHGSTALPQSLLLPCTPPWVSYQVPQSLVHTDMEVVLHHLVFLTVTLTSVVAECTGEESKRGISESGKASLEEGKWQLGSFSVLTEEGLERGAVIRPDSTHRLPAESPSLAQRLTIRRQRTLGVTYSNL